MLDVVEQPGAMAATGTAWWTGLAARVAQWFGTLPCPAPGRWPIAAQALHPWSVDATSLALDLALMLGLSVPVDAALAALDGEQASGTGFFHEPHAAELDANVPRIHEMSGTYLGYQVAAVMLALGRPPRHRFAFYDPLLPAGRLERYMAENMPWDRAPMGAGNMCDHGATMLRANARFFDRDALDAQHALVRMRCWLDAHQSPVTGLWGAEAAQGKNGLVQAGYHLMRGLHFFDDVAPAWCERITDTTLASLSGNAHFAQGQGEGCHDMDHFVVLERMLRFTNGYREADIRGWCSRRLDQLQCLQQADGGFCFEAAGSITNHNRHDVTLGLRQSDLVGTVFYLETLLRQFRVLGLPVPWRSSATHGVAANGPLARAAA